MSPSLRASGSQPAAPRVLGRYALFDEIARGGMATVHFGRLLGPAGFSKTVAIKRLHPVYASDVDFVTMFLDEARLAARVQHPNVVPTLDVVADFGEVALVMEYVPGEGLSKLVAGHRAAHARIPLPIVGALLDGILAGLHAAHEAKNERGEPLHLVHRDMSPQNVLVGADGVVRVFDFGVAKAVDRLSETKAGHFKGKLAYAAPEQFDGSPLDRRVDVYATGVVLWELLTGRRLFAGQGDLQLIAAARAGAIDPPSRWAPDLPPGLDEVVLRALAADPDRRFATAFDLALALEGLLPRAGSRALAEWVRVEARDALDRRARTVEAIERESVATTTDVSTILRASVPPMATPTARIGSVTTHASLGVSRNGRSGTKRAALIASVGGIGLVVGLALPWLRGAEAHSTLGQTRTSPQVPRERAAEDRAASTAAEDRAAEVAPPPSSPRAVAVAPKPAAKAPPASVLAVPPPSASSPPAERAIAPAESCAPPYTIDARGIRKPKPHCL
jgi:serine/threonine-protein kinase